MNITGTLLESILEQPIDNVNNMLFVSVQIFIFTKLNQLLKVLYTQYLAGFGNGCYIDGIG